jgi:hypothetical protein
MAEIVVVTGEPPWPAVHGGRVRTARLAEALAHHFAVCVGGPPEGTPPPGVDFEPLPAQAPPARTAAVLSPAPFLGHSLMGPARAGAVARLVAARRPLAVVFAHGYLAATAGDPGVPTVVDFADVERRRQASLARRGSVRSRSAAAVECAKALGWERRLARRVDLAVATSAADAALLRSWGAAVVVAPHGADPVTHTPSPPGGPVTFVAGMGYAPNTDAARLLVHEVWPALERAAPAIRLRLVGRAAGQVLGWVGRRGAIEVVADPPAVGAYYREASVVCVPVGTGGGSQVKVAHALAHCRVVVASPFSARSAPAGAGDGLVVAPGTQAMGEAVLNLWRDVSGRHARERFLADRRPVPTWDGAFGPLLGWLLRLAVRTIPVATSGTAARGCGGGAAGAMGGRPVEVLDDGRAGPCGDGGDGGPTAGALEAAEATGAEVAGEAAR